MTSIIIVAITAVAAVIGSYVTWRIAKRNTSGAIDTSVAADLWAEGGKIRGELRTDLAETKVALNDAITAVKALNDELRLSRERTESALEESRLSRQETRELKTQITELTGQLTELHQVQIAALQEVQTHNTLTIGGLADNIESRRIMDIPKNKRTDEEHEHLRTASNRLPDDLAASQKGDDKDEH